MGTNYLKFLNDLSPSGTAVLKWFGGRGSELTAYVGGSRNKTDEGLKWDGTKTNIHIYLGIYIGNLGLACMP